MLQKGLSGAAEDSSKFRPGIRGAHVDDPHRFDACLGRFNTKQSRGLAVLNAAPELPLGGDDEMLIERIGGGSDFDPFAAAGDHRSTALLAAITHMLCCSCGIYFSAAASSENDQGSMNLASNTAPVASTRPSSVAAIQRSTGCRIRRCTSLSTCPLLAWYQRRFSSSVANPSCTMRLPDRFSGSISPRFSRHSRRRAASSLPIMIRASEPPMKCRRSARRRFVDAFEIAPVIDDRIALGTESA